MDECSCMAFCGSLYSICGHMESCRRNHELVTEQLQVNYDVAMPILVRSYGMRSNDRINQFL